MRYKHKRLKASQAEEDGHEEVVQMQNIVKCFRRPGVDGQRATYTCAIEGPLCLVAMTVFNDVCFMGAYP